MLVRKNTVANAAVVRLRKFAEPLAPNRLPDAPLPKAAPMSAPLPCCSRTSPTNAMATNTCIIQTTNSITSSTCPANGQELLGIERGPADQTAVDIRLTEQLDRIGRLDAAPVLDDQVFRHAGVQGTDLAPDEGMYGLRL